MSLLEVENISIRFGGLTAVSDVSLKVDEGQIFSVIGPNGAGKTTLFNIITGVYVPLRGVVKFRGSALARPFVLRTVLGIFLIGLLSAFCMVVSLNIETLWSEAISAHYIYLEPFPWSAAWTSAKALLLEKAAENGAAVPLLTFCFASLGALLVWRRSRLVPEVVCCRGICRTFQNIRLFPKMSVLENVMVGIDRKFTYGCFSAVFRLPIFFQQESDARSKSLAVLKLVELEDKADLPASSLAYGHQRRLEIARALVACPALLLLDEPAAGMNPVEAAELVELIRKIRDTGVTILLIEHHMRVVMSISDRIAVLDYGHKIAEGTPEEIRTNPKVIAAYLGDEVGVEEEASL